MKRFAQPKDSTACDIANNAIQGGGVCRCLTRTPFNTLIFCGWFVVAATFAIGFVGFGSAYTFGIFAGALQKAFAASRGLVSLVFSLAGFLYFALGIIAGPLADRWGSRRLAVVGMILMGIGLAVASLARNLEEVYAAYGLGVGLGIGCSFVPALGAVQRWFSRRRGFASGIAVSGIGAGTLLMPPLASWLIGSVGWRGAYLVLAGVVGIVGGGMALLIENDPRDCALTPDGETPVAAQPASPPGVPLAEALKSRQFAGLYAACLIGSFALFLPYVHIVPYATNLGVSRAAAVLLLCVMGAGSIAGRILIGGLADRVGRRGTFLLTYAAMACALVLWTFSEGLGSLAVFSLVYGAFSGGFVALLPALLTDYFGVRNISGIIGVLYTSVALGTLLGPAAAGFAFDIDHSYTLPILVGAGANLLAAGIAATVASPREA